MKAVSLVRRMMIAALVGALLAGAAAAFLVTAQPSAAQTPQYQVPLDYLRPIPIVRIAGRIRSTGVRVTLLQITSPRGSAITIRCSGGRRRGCSFKSKTKHSPESKKVRVRELQHGLKAGVKISIFVRKGNTVGKYTRFTVRKRRAPARTDRCLLPGDPFEPQPCPS